MPIFASNFSSNSLSGTTTVAAGNVTVNLSSAAFALEGDRTFVVKLRKVSSQGAVIATSPIITIKDTTTFVSLTANTATVAEGNLVSFSLVTTNVVNGATVYYSVLPATANVTADDFVSNTGSTVITNNAATFALKANADVSLSNEDGETFKVQLRTNSPTGNVVFATSNIEILDTYKTYNVLSFAAGSASPIVSGSNVTFTFVATNVPSGTLFYYSTTGNVTSFSSNTGSFALNSISNTLVITNPQTPFAASRAYNVIVRSGSASGPIVTASNAMVVMDDSILPLIGTGGTETTANGFTINYFTTSGNITFNKGGTVEYVAISGGGGGYGGGGGAGRVYDSATNGLKTVVAGNVYTVTIGAGGTASGGTGGSTVFDSLTITGGNGGGIGSPSNGGAGGSSSQPFAGGNPAANTPMGLGGAGGGGGGAGGAGTPGTTANPNPSPSAGGSIAAGPGGAGRSAISISGGSTLYAGGGGGGSKSGSRGLGGSGGGGNGEQLAYYGGSFGTAGTFFAVTTGNVNTGSGGGGGAVGDGSSGATGGSGIVIVRYTTPAVTFASLTTPTTLTYEGSNVVFTLNTTNVSNNTLLYYYTVGNVLSSHFVSGNTGSFRITQNSTNITLRSNTTIPANEERFFQLRIVAESGTSADPLITSNVFTIKDIALRPAPQGQIDYTTAGTYSFVVPVGVSNVSVVAVGGGGGGGAGVSGGGGGLGWKNNIPVTPGTSYTVVVGIAGTGGAGGTATNGGTSYFISAPTVSGIGGTKGNDIPGGPNSGGAGGGYTGDGGGNGGTAGATFSNLGSYGGSTNGIASGGGGGAGGYIAAGGNGGSAGTRAAPPGDGATGSSSTGYGGGGGGGAGDYRYADGRHLGAYGGYGGGVGIYGQGSNGTGGAGGPAATYPAPAPFGPGYDGVAGSADPTSPTGYGGGGNGGGSATHFGSGASGVPGVVGAVRIIWGGVDRLYPNNAANVSVISY